MMNNYFRLHIFILKLNYLILFLLNRKNIKTPVVCTNSPHRLKAPLLPEYVIKDKFLGLKDIPELPIKGNFAAFEEPKIIADNIYDSIYKLDEEFLSTI